MALEELGRTGNGGSPATLFLVSGGIVFEIVAVMCSSPQTMEINAEMRAPTLMKWVTIGLVVSAVFILVAVSLDKRRWPTIAGGGLAGVIMYVAYRHAMDAGLKNKGPTTEFY